MTEIYASIIEVTRRVGTLGKAQFNPHGQYKYVGIDKYYEKVSGIAADLGLSWVLVQDKFELHPNVGKSGMLEISYRVNLFHSSGAVIENFSYLSIIHPIQGAQTVGSALSYADKTFQRQLFKVSTGEEDADSTAPDDISNFTGKKTVSLDEVEKITRQTEVKRNVVEKETEDVFGAIFFDFIPDCSSIDDLVEFYQENEQVLLKLKTNFPAKHKKIMDAFTSRKQILIKEGSDV